MQHSAILNHNNVVIRRILLEMKWIKFSLETTTEAVDILSYELDAIGVEGIEIEDKLPLTESEKEQMYVDILPDPEDNDGSATIHFYLNPDCNREEIISRVQTIFSEVSSYCDIGKGTIQISETEDKDWLNNWKQFFKPFRAAENIVIKPTWEDYTPENDSDILIEIDPGIAFGTGSHETTKLCIQALRKYTKKGSIKMIDLHIHSTNSDGTDSIQEILQKAQKLNLNYISITDHDTCDGYKEL